VFRIHSALLRLGLIVTLTLRTVFAWSLAIPALVVGMVAACGLEVAGTQEKLPEPEPSGTASLPPPPANTGPRRDADTLPDATPTETCAWPSLQRDAPWPMIGGCVGHPGRTVHRGPKQQPKVVWTVKISTRDSLPVIGADDTVYLPANDNGIVAFDPDGGRREIADAGTGPANNVTNAPSIGADGTLYFGSERAVMALRKTGTYWRFAIAEEVDTSTLIDEDGTVYSGSFDDKLYAIASDGGKLWERPLGADIWASAAIGPSHEIYVGASNDLYALQRDGGESWRFETTGDIQSSPVVADDGTIYIGSNGFRLHAVNADGGAKWTFITKGNLGWQQLPALGKDGTIYAPTERHLAAIDPNDGGAVWDIDVGATLRTSVVVDADGHLFVGGDKKMFSFNPDGTKRWEADLEDNAFGFAIGRTGTIFVALNGNKLVALHE
jgi:outer membrane protein assembly factor BamB